ncbi:MAG: ABC transporter substrate-binding protein [Parasporobacterium sp.]|nr:ABC transporter substrate-binding protein [Parasporobacterium sp.]
MKKVTRILAVVLALCMGLALAACGGGSADTGNAESGGSGEAQAAPVSKDLVVGTPISTQGFDPATSNNGIGLNLVYERLFRLDPATGEVKGALAESWEWLDDAHSQLKIKIREGATFSNGSPVTAEDVLFSLKYYLEAGSNLATYFNNYDYDNSEILDEKTLVLHYINPTGSALNLLCLGEIQCKAYYEEKGADAFWDAPVGSGAYTCSENVSGDHATYVRRSDYDGTMPEAETITVRSYAEPSTMFIDFENGDLDAAFDLEITDTDRAVADTSGAYTVTLQPDYDTNMFVLSDNVDEFKSDLVRQAIALGVDWQAVAEASYGQNLCTLATSILPEGMKYKINVGTYEYNPEKAKELMKEAGYENGFDILLIGMSDPAGERMAVTIQGYLAALNINMTTEFDELTVAVVKLMKGESNCMVKSIPGGATAQDPDQVLDLMKKTSTNLSCRVNNDEFDGYIMGGLYAIDEEVRADQYAKAQQWAYDNCWVIPVCDTYTSYVTKTGIELKTNSGSYPDLTLVHYAE